MASLVWYSVAKTENPYQDGEDCVNTENGTSHEGFSVAFKKEVNKNNREKLIKKVVNSIREFFEANVLKLTNVKNGFKVKDKTEL
jgi:hypothetical protein